jgi:T5SS/PEP-CTERM-associated repeat protein
MFHRCAILLDVSLSSKSLLSLLFLGAVLIAGPLPTLRALITSNGSVSPSNPSNWTSATEATIGYPDGGTLTVNQGSHLLSSTAYIGQSSNGVVTVDGNGSTWTIPNSSTYITLGQNGTGTLNISNGGTVVVGGTIWVYGGTGGIAFGTGGGTLTTGSLAASAGDIVNSCVWKVFQAATWGIQIPSTKIVPRRTSTSTWVPFKSLHLFDADCISL